MTEFEPLRETSTSAFERALLRSADRDVPSPRAFTKTAAALGVGGALLSTAGNTVAAAGSTSALATFWTMALKPLLIGAAGGLVVAVSAHRVFAPGEPAKPPTPVVYERAPVANPSEMVESRSSPLAPLAEPAPQVDERRRSSPVERSVAPSPSGPNAPAPKSSSALVPDPDARPSEPAPLPAVAVSDSGSIAKELANVDRARQALRDGRPADALHELDVYRVAWPSGVLATEAAVLRIEAHLALGDRTSGIRAARAFLAANPSGRYATRVRSLFKPSELE